METSALIQTLVGGLLALSGAFIGSYFQRRHDRWLFKKSDQKLRREKAETLFIEFSKLTKFHYKSTTGLLRSILDEKPTQQDELNFGPMRSIAAVYFPDIVDEIDSIELSFPKLERDLHPRIRAAANDGNTEQMRDIVNNVMVEEKQLWEKLSTHLRHTIQMDLSVLSSS